MRVNEDNTNTERIFTFNRNALKQRLHSLPKGKEWWGKYRFLIAALLVVALILAVFGIKFSGVNVLYPFMSPEQRIVSIAKECKMPESYAIHKDESYAFDFKWVSESSMQDYIMANDGVTKNMRGLDVYACLAKRFPRNGELHESYEVSKDGLTFEVNVGNQETEEYGWYEYSYTPYDVRLYVAEG